MKKVVVVGLGYVGLPLALLLAKRNKVMAVDTDQQLVAMLKRGETPKTGTAPANVSIPGLTFPYPQYLQNIVAQVYRRWDRPRTNAPLRAEVFFTIQRDGSVNDIRFIRRSGNFAFDLGAQGAVEAAANAGAFGRLPDGFGEDILPVSFFFTPRGS